MSKIYKGWELMKAIAEGEIERGSRFILIDQDDEIEKVCWTGENFKYIYNGENITADYADIELINSTFKKIENEIDIENIPELLIEQLKDKGFTNADIYMLAQQQNNLLQAIKQLDKRLEKLED